jgi:hypothetical protein
MHEIRVAAREVERDARYARREERELRRNEREQATLGRERARNIADITDLIAGEAQRRERETRREEQKIESVLAAVNAEKMRTVRGLLALGRELAHDAATS